MAFAFGQNATELGRNIIDLEQLKNARDAQQAQAQNQFLAQLNQAMLGRQQLGAQTQQSNNALMMQALQQQANQEQQNRDFGLRQQAQTNQATQFGQELGLRRDLGMLGDPTIRRQIYGENVANAEQDRSAAANLPEAQREMASINAAYAAAKLKTHGETFYGWNSADNLLKQKLADKKAHSDAITAVADKYNKLFPGSFTLVPSLYKPGFSAGVDNFDTFDFKLAPRPQIMPPSRGQQFGLEDPNNPLPGGGVPHPKPALDAGAGNPIPIVPTSAAIAVTPPPTVSSSGILDAIKGFMSRQLYGRSSIPKSSSPIPSTPRQSDFIPMLGPNGVVQGVPKSGVLDALNSGDWTLHPSVTGFAPQIPDVQNPISADFNPIPTY